MTLIYNKVEVKQRRRDLRGNPTPAEKIVWGYLKNKQLEGCKFRRQRSVGAYIVDFYCSELRLVIELDGDSHFNEKAIAYDARRTAYLESLNLRCLRFTNLEIYYDLENVLEKIRKIVFNKA